MFEPQVSWFDGQTLVGVRNRVLHKGAHLAPPAATWRIEFNDPCAAAMRSYVILI